MIRCHWKVSKNFVLAGSLAAVWRLNVKGNSGCRENSEGVTSPVLREDFISLEQGAAGLWRRLELKDASVRYLPEG